MLVVVVILVLIVYIKVVVVKKFVVGFLMGIVGLGVLFLCIGVFLFFLWGICLVLVCWVWELYYLL